MNFETFDYSVCSDCLLFAADGELPDNDAYAMDIALGSAEINTQWRYKGAVWACLAPGDEDHPLNNEFDVTPCECCGTHLAGSRHHAVCLVKWK